MLITYATRFRDWLHRTANSFKNQNAAIHETENATVQRNEPAPILRPELHISDSVIHEIKAKTQDEKRSDDWKIRLEVGTLAIVLAYTIVAAYQWWELDTQNINQSAASIGAGATADRATRQGIIALHADQRAWLMTTFNPEEVATVVQGMLQEPLTTENIGKTPASKITGIVVLRLLRSNESPNFDFIDEDVKSIELGTYKPPEHLKGHEMMFHIGSLFPHIPKRLTIQGNDVTQKEFANYPRSAYIAMYGSIVYDDVFGHRHWTHFCSFECADAANSLTDQRIKCANYNGIDGDIE